MQENNGLFYVMSLQNFLAMLDDKIHTLNQTLSFLWLSFEQIQS